MTILLTDVRTSSLRTIQSLWFTKILDLIPIFPKVHRWSLWFALCTHLVPGFFQKYMDGPQGLHFVTNLVPNLDMIKPLDLLAAWA
ncbi:hypothetical protein Hanom_Chr01g00091151 [Helianthus anomalus]